MDISRKLKLALTCVAISGLTVACTNDSDPVVAGVVNADSKKKKDKDKDEDPSATEESAAQKRHRQLMESKVNLSSQLLAIVALDQECATTDEILEKGWANRALFYRASAVEHFNIAVEFFGKKVMEEKDLSCRAAALAAVSKRFYEDYMSDPGRAEEDERQRNYAKVEVFLAHIQPTLENVKSLLFIREQIEQPVHDVNAMLDEAASLIETLKGLRAQIAEMSFVCAGPFCTTTNQNTASYSTILSARLRMFEKSLEDVDAVQGIPAVTIVRAQMLKKLINLLKAEVIIADNVIEANTEKAADTGLSNQEQYENAAYGKDDNAAASASAPSKATDLGSSPQEQHAKSKATDLGSSPQEQHAKSNAVAKPSSDDAKSVKTMDAEEAARAK